MCRLPRVAFVIMRLAAMPIACFAIVAMLPASARANLADDRSRCLARTGVPAQAKFDACTAVIESGQETPRGLISAFNSRGNVHLSN